MNEVKEEREKDLINKLETALKTYDDQNPSLTTEEKIRNTIEYNGIT